MSQLGRRAGPLVALAVVLAGCGAGAAGPSSAPATATVPPPTLPPCASGAPVEVPAEFPAALPLPPGAVVTVAEVNGKDVVVQLLAPMSIAELGAFLEAAFPPAGFTLGDGEAEPDELEQAFSGDGGAGQVTARHSGDCEDALNVRVAFRTT